MFNREKNVFFPKLSSWLSRGFSKRPIDQSIIYWPVAPIPNGWHSSTGGRERPRRSSLSSAQVVAGRNRSDGPWSVQTTRKRNLGGKTWAGSASWRPWKRSRRPVVDGGAARSSRKSWSFRRAMGCNRMSCPLGTRRLPSRRPPHFCRRATKRAFQVSAPLRVFRIKAFYYYKESTQD